ncbi:MAG: tyrosine-type recombinase/integrase [Fimbriimonadales bacterium]|nr:MAG: tyrosine recombinase XerD [Fimbriimonadales bacterium]
MLKTNGLQAVAQSPLQEALQLWLLQKQLESESQKTLRSYSEVGREFVNTLSRMGIADLDAVKPLHIRQWLLERKQQVSPHTLQKLYRTAHAFWRFCMREGLTENDPFSKVDKPRVPQKVKPALTPEQVDAILRACEGKDWLRLRDRALILLLLDTGLRIHEAHKLTVGDARQESLLIRGKGGKQRVVFLSPEVRLALSRYLRACPLQLTDSDPLWHGRWGALTLWGIMEVVEKIGKRAGLQKPLGAHAFRRTFATWSLRNGIDLEQLRQLMGHSDYGVLRQYLALVEADLKQAHAQHSPLRNLRGGRNRNG